jgi:hypothetical protein
VARGSVLVGLAGVHLGLLGLIIAAGSPEAAKQSGSAILFPVFLWVIGSIFLAGAYIAETRAEW